MPKLMCHYYQLGWKALFLDCFAYGGFILLVWDELKVTLLKETVILIHSMEEPGTKFLTQQP